MGKSVVYDWEERMKVFAIVLLATATLGWEMEEKMVKMWTKMKAHEACWGEENTKQYTVKMKKAIAKCTQQDAPELQLPIYRNPYRVVNGLLNGAQEHERYVVSLLETIANNMNNNNDRMYNNMNTMNNGNFNQRNGFNSQYGNSQYMNNDMVPLSQEYVQKLATEVMRRMQTQNQYNPHSNSNVLGKLFQGQAFGNNQNQAFGNNHNQAFGNNFNNMRFKRQADAGVTNVLDLGDRLRDKIVEA